MKKEQKKIAEFTIKTGLGVITTLLTYQLIKDATSGHPLSIALLSAGLISLNHIGKNERRVANLGQKARDAAIGASFIDTLKHYANNITAGAVKTTHQVEKTITLCLG